MDIRPPFVAHNQATEVVQPGKRALGDPSVPTEPCRRLDTASRDAGHDASNSTRGPTSPVIVSFVGMKLCRASTPATASLPDRLDGVENLVQRNRIVLVGRREHRRRQGDAVSIDDEVVLRAEFAAIRGVAARLLATSLGAYRPGVGRNTRPVDAALVPEVVQDDVQNAIPDAGLLPIAQAAPAGHPAAAAHFLRQVFPRDACLEDKQDARKRFAIRQRLAPVRLGPLGWEQRFDYVPQVVW